MTLTLDRHSFSVLLIVVVGLAGCGKSDETPTFAIMKGELKVHCFGGPNYCLRYDLDYRGASGPDAIEIVEITDGKSFSRHFFQGKLGGHCDLMLMGTFLNDGNTARIEELKDRIKIMPAQMDLRDKNEVVLLEYVDLSGKSVRYVVRCEQRS